MIIPHLARGPERFFSHISQFLKLGELCVNSKAQRSGTLPLVTQLMSETEERGKDMDIGSIGAQPGGLMSTAITLVTSTGAGYGLLPLYIQEN